MREKISPSTARRVQFVLDNVTHNAPRPGVYVDGHWVGELVAGNAYYPKQVRYGDRLSPSFKVKDGVRGNVSRIIRQMIIAWVISCHEDQQHTC